MKRFSLLTLALLFASAGAGAHSDEYLDMQTAAHHGQVRMAGLYHLELVVDKKADSGAEHPLTVYVTDHGGTPIATPGASGSARIRSGGKSSVIVLSPTGDNGLAGRGKYALSPRMEVEISVTLPGEEPVKARYLPLARADNSSAAH